MKLYDDITFKPWFSTAINDDDNDHDADDDGR